MTRITRKNCFWILTAVFLLIMLYTAIHSHERVYLFEGGQITLPAKYKEASYVKYNPSLFGAQSDDSGIWENRAVYTVDENEAVCIASCKIGDPYVEVTLESITSFVRNLTLLHDQKRMNIETIAEASVTEQWGYYSFYAQITRAYPILKVCSACFLTEDEVYLITYYFPESEGKETDFFQYLKSVRLE